MWIETNKCRYQKNKWETNKKITPDVIKKASEASIKIDASSGLAITKTSVGLSDLRKWVKIHANDTKNIPKLQNNWWIDSILNKLPNKLYEIVWWKIYENWDLEIKITRSWILKKIIIAWVEYILNPWQWDIINKKFTIMKDEQTEEDFLITNSNKEEIKINLSTLVKNIKVKKLKNIYLVHKDFGFSGLWDITFEIA